MKKYLAIVLLLITVLLGCTKPAENTGDDCHKGTIKINNLSSFKYEVFVDHKSVQIVDKKSVFDHSVFTGTYFVKIVQNNGYLVDPKVTEHYVTITGCDTREIVINKLPGE